MKFYIFISLIVLITKSDAGVSGRSYSTYTGGAAGFKSGMYRGGNYFMSGQPYGGNNNNNLGTTVSPLETRSHGISTFGIIMIILTIISLGFIGYWVIVCYPLFKKKEDVDYERVHAVSVTTTRTNSGEYIPSFNYSNEEKKLENN